MEHNFDMGSARLRRVGVGFALLVAFTVAVVFYEARPRGQSASVTDPDVVFGVTKQDLAQALGTQERFEDFPTEVDIPLDEHGRATHPTRSLVQYSFDPRLQEQMRKLFHLHGPDHGALVVMDASTGRVLSMVSYSRRNPNAGNLALRATFPSASVFKVVTAAAAISERNFSPETPVAFNGRNHTLYRSNILKTNVTRWTRTMTLKEAFAKSVNTVFGKIGAFEVGPAGLRQYADRFGFNRRLAADIPLQESRAQIPDDPWGAAEAASGYTRENTMSPLQGALIAAALANDGVMMEPFLVESVHRMDGTRLYQAQPKIANTVVSPEVASEVRELMRQTVVSGTSRRAFKGFFRGRFASLGVGGKTGHLTGNDPPGSYDWFVGFAEEGQRRIAIAALTINEKQWRVKSSYLARRAIESYFNP